MALRIFQNKVSFLFTCLPARLSTCEGPAPETQVQQRLQRSGFHTFLGGTHILNEFGTEELFSDFIKFYFLIKMIH